jgi:hypothetical protein
MRSCHPVGFALLCFLPVGGCSDDSTPADGAVVADGPAVLHDAGPPDVGPQPEAGRYSWVGGKTQLRIPIGKGMG